MCPCASCCWSVRHDLNRECDIWNSPFSIFVCVCAYIIFANMLQFLVDQRRCVCWQKVAWTASAAPYFSCPTVIFSSYSFNKPVMAHAVSWSCASFQGKKYGSCYLLKGALWFKMYVKNSFCIRSPSRWQFPPWRCLRLLIFQVASWEEIWRRWFTLFLFLFFQVALFAIKWGGMMTDGGERIIKAHTMQLGPNIARNNTSRLTLLSSWSHNLRVLKTGRAASSPHKAIAGQGAALQIIFFLEMAMNLWPLELFLLWRRCLSFWSKNNHLSQRRRVFVHMAHQFVFDFVTAQFCVVCITTL